MDSVSSPSVASWLHRDFERHVITALGQPSSRNPWHGTRITEPGSRSFSHHRFFVYRPVAWMANSSPESLDLVPGIEGGTSSVPPLYAGCGMGLKHPELTGLEHDPLYSTVISSRVHDLRLRRELLHPHPAPTLFFHHGLDDRQGMCPWRPSQAGPRGRAEGKMRRGLQAASGLPNEG